MGYIITCTSTCDLTKELLKEKNIPYACFRFLANDREYLDDFGSEYPFDKFYNDISEGMEPTTSQVGYGQYLEFFEKYLNEGNDILHICLSSGLSGDYTTAYKVAEELNESHENKIHVIDSLGASSGYGMLCLMAKDNLDKGMSIEENVKWLEENKLTIHHWFFSSDLSSYIRGGRISKAAGFFGTALKICPVMNMNSEGKLVPLEKIRTKAKAIKTMVEHMVENADKGNEYDGYCSLSHSSCIEDAEAVKALILETFPNVKNVDIYDVGTTIGAHTGPGTVALYFKGKERKE